MPISPTTSTPRMAEGPRRRYTIEHGRPVTHPAIATRMAKSPWQGTRRATAEARLSHSSCGTTLLSGRYNAPQRPVRRSSAAGTTLRSEPRMAEARGDGMLQIAVSRTIWPGTTLLQGPRRQHTADHRSAEPSSTTLHHEWLESPQCRRTRHAKSTVQLAAHCSFAERHTDGRELAATAHEEHTAARRARLSQCKDEHSAYQLVSGRRAHEPARHATAKDHGLKDGAPHGHDSDFWPSRPVTKRMGTRLRSTRAHGNLAMNVDVVVDHTATRITIVL